MQTLEAIRRRLNTAEDLHGVVRVMKALAAVSIRQYEQAVASLADYSRTVEMGLQILLRQKSGMVHPPATDRDCPATAIVIGSDQGMCGAFNENIAAFALDSIQGAKTTANRILALGSRVNGLIEGHIDVAKTYSLPSSLPGVTTVVEQVLLEVESMHFQQGVERVMLYHNRPLSGGSYRSREQNLLPLDANWLADVARKPWDSRSLPIYTMERESLFAALIRQYLFVSLYRAVAESLASENAARLAAMQAAEKNIEDHRAQLHLRFHQQRQQSITAELLDILSGFEALAESSKLERNS